MGRMSKVLERKGRALKEPGATGFLCAQAGQTRIHAPQKGKRRKRLAPSWPIRRLRWSLPSLRSRRLVSRPPRGRRWKRNENAWVSYFAPASPQGKRIDILRSQLLYPFHGDPPRTIMITSAVPREGPQPAHREPGHIFRPRSAAIRHDYGLSFDGAGYPFALGRAPQARPDRLSGRERQRARHHPSFPGG